VYADDEALASWLGVDQQLPEGADPDRWLERASRTVDRMVTAAYQVGEDEAPTDEAVATALSEATCAVVEYWLVAGGEDVDRVVLGGPVGFDGATVGVMPSWQPPRALEVLRQAGLVGEPGAR
jgi:hypothetical protein